MMIPSRRYPLTRIFDFLTRAPLPAISHLARIIPKKIEVSPVGLFQRSPARGDYSARNGLLLAVPLSAEQSAHESFVYR
ncbi:protein of unknown function [Kyrpidia spormannii]|uniref:Uncharacterized protein n=2 Tax=Kyrpidia spormannii TaxID=2055160 RepID=A0ACA8Z6C0_9BACL|nr:protein of unknown function [Kyrpidia spormannii]CAB3391168.1 protein of unknown function [Kyrpidia spormannii]